MDSQKITGQLLSRSFHSLLVGDDLPYGSRSGRYTLNGNVTLEARTVSVNNKWCTINFGATFTGENVPLVFDQTMTYNLIVEVNVTDQSSIKLCQV